MTDPFISFLLGAVAMASWVAALIFLRYWRLTGDTFFLWFSTAFGLDSVTRLVLAMNEVSDELEPFFYISRLVTFSLIIAAIVLKNRPSRSR